MIYLLMYLKVSALAIGAVCVVGAYLYFYGKEVNHEDI